MRASRDDGRRLRGLTVVVATRSGERAARVVDTACSGTRVVALLNRVEAAWGLPMRIPVDNGPQFTSQALDDWAHRHRITLVFNRPGTPTAPPSSAAFTGRFRTECLDQHWFASWEEARQISAAWRIDANEVRPHTARTPPATTRRQLPTRQPTYETKQEKKLANSMVGPILRGGSAVLSLA